MSWNGAGIRALGGEKRKKKNRNYDDEGKKRIAEIVYRTELWNREIHEFADTGCSCWSERKFVFAKKFTIDNLVVVHT